MADLEPLEREMAAIIEIGERVLAKHRAAEGVMADLVKQKRFDPPCHINCEGWINYDFEGELLQGACPLINQAPPCLIPVRTEQALTGDLGRAGWPSRYLTEAKWELCPVEKVLRALPGNSGVLILGPVGTGKTTAAALIARQRWPRATTSYVYWGSLLEQMERRLPEIARAEALCIDDFGVGTIPDWKLGLIDYLWEYRNSRRLTTIVTSNQTKDELAADPASARWVDRWRQLMPHVVTIGGESKRGEG